MIPEGWRKVKISEIATVTSGGTPDRKKTQYWNGNIPWVTTSLVDFNIIDKADEFITEEGLRNSAAKWLPKGTILMAMYGQGVTRGKVSLLGIGATTNQACAAINVNEGTHNSFLFYCLAHKYRELRYLAHGSQQENLNGELIKNFWILIPPLPEQRKIAEILSTWDEAIAKTELLIAALRRRKQGLMQCLLTGQVRFPGFEGEWRAITLPEILKNEKGAIKVGPFGSQLKKEELVKAGFKVYGQENVYQNDFSTGSRYIDKKKFEGLKSCEILPGDFLITMMGTIGKSAIVPEGIETGIQDSHLIRLRVNEKIFSKRFLAYLFQSFEINKQVRRQSVGGIMEGLSSQIIQRLKVPITTIEEQELIANVIEVCDQELSVAMKQKELLTIQKKGLMQRLLTGQVRVKV